MNVKLLAEPENDIPGVATIGSDGSVEVKTERANYNFTADGWGAMLLHDMAEVVGDGT